jgi:SAM-dependent methyltransferase
MTTMNEEDINAFNEDVKAFLNKVSDEKKLLGEDLKLIEHPLSNGKICDFGCGSGYTTYSLMSILNATEGIGIDIDPAAIHRAALWFKAIKLHKQLNAKENLSDSVITQEANHILGIVKPPEFKVGNVVSGENLPSDVSLAYCRRLLVNIVHGNYHDNLSGAERAKLAIKNMVNSIIPGGWIVAVEDASGGNFCRLLEEENLYCWNIIRFQLNGVIPFYRYVYRKPQVGI